MAYLISVWVLAWFYRYSSTLSNYLILNLHPLSELIYIVYHADYILIIHEGAKWARCSGDEVSIVVFIETSY